MSAQYHHKSKVIRRVASLSAALVFLSTFASTALAQRGARDHACESACHQKAHAHNRSCRGQRGCTVSRREMRSVCTQVCQPQAPPTDAEIQAIAEAKAEDITDMPVEIYETIDYLDADGTPRTRLFVFTTDNLPRRSHLVRILQNQRVRDIVNDRIVCVEIGLKPHLPPIVGYWQGMPVEHLVETDARNRLARDHDSANPVLTRRYGNALTPVLEFEDEQGRIAVDGRNFHIERNANIRVVARRQPTSNERLVTRQAWNNQLRRAGR